MVCHFCFLHNYGNQGATNIKKMKILDYFSKDL